jgi:hypothetical protein
MPGDRYCMSVVSWLKEVGRQAADGKWKEGKQIRREESLNCASLENSRSLGG